MKPFLKRLIIFLFFSAVMYVLLIALFVRAKVTPPVKDNLPISNVLNTMFRDLQQANNTDLLFVGSSHCSNGFDTRVFDAMGWHSFNLGSSAQSPKHSLVLLNTYLNRMQVRVLVCEVYYVLFSKPVNLIEPNLAILANAPFEPELTALFNIEIDLRMVNLLIKSLLAKALNWTAVYDYKPTEKDASYVAKGFYEKTNTQQSVQSFQPVVVEFDTSQVHALRQIIALAKSKNIQVKLIQLPISSGLYNSFTNRNTFDSMMAALGEYHNLNGKVALNDTLDFFDENHLNASGVKKLNPMLESIIGSPVRAKTDYRNQ